MGIREMFKKGEATGQDGGIGRYPLPHHTTKRRTNWKTKINQNCQKIKLYEILTTKELKKKHSSILVGGEEMGSRGRENVWQGSSWWSRWSHICMWVYWKEQLGSKTGFQWGEIKPQNLWLKKPVGVQAAEETPSLTGELIGETHSVLEYIQNLPPGNQHQKGPIYLWVVEEVTESQQRAEQIVCGLLPHIQHHNAVM